MKNVTRHELVATIAAETQIKFDDVRQVLEEFFHCIENHLASNHRLEIRGFGSIYMKQRKPKLVRNPKRPQETKILPARWAPVLRYSRELKVAINQPFGPETESIFGYDFIVLSRDFVESEIQKAVSTFDDLVSQGSKKMVVDFLNVRYIYSPGLAALARFQRILNEKDGQLFLVNVKPSVQAKLESVNLERLIPLYRTREAFFNDKKHPD